MGGREEAGGRDRESCSNYSQRRKKIYNAGLVYDTSKKSRNKCLFYSFNQSFFVCVEIWDSFKGEGVNSLKDLVLFLLLLF